MPPVKEINFFGARFPSQKNISNISNFLVRASDDYSCITRDEKFLEYFQSLKSIRNHPFKVYKDMFSISDTLLTGDISPLYSTLDQSNINSIYSSFPNLKIIVLIRDPLVELGLLLTML